MSKKATNPMNGHEALSRGPARELFRELFPRYFGSVNLSVAALHPHAVVAHEQISREATPAMNLGQLAAAEAQNALGDVLRDQNPDVAEELGRMTITQQAQGLPERQDA